MKFEKEEAIGLDFEEQNLLSQIRNYGKEADRNDYLIAERGLSQEAI